MILNAFAASSVCGISIFYPSQDNASLGEPCVMGLLCLLGGGICPASASFDAKHQGNFAISTIIITWCNIVIRTFVFKSTL